MSPTSSIEGSSRARSFVIVVEARPEHFKAFRELNLQWIDEHFEREAKDIETLNDPKGTILDKGGQIFVAMHDHEAIGACAVVPWESDGEYELVKMGVHPKSRGLGAGRALMHAAEAWCAKRGSRRIVIVTNSVLTPAVRLYESFGYDLIHSGPHPSYKRADLIFEKRVKC